MDGSDSWREFGKREQASNDWKQKLADQHIRRRIITNGIDEIFAADFVEMQKFSKWNKGIRYLSMIIDTFSKFRWIFPLRDKH